MDLRCVPDDTLKKEGTILGFKSVRGKNALSWCVADDTPVTRVSY